MWQGWDSGEVSSQREGLRFPGWPLSSTLATRYEETTHWKRPGCWERLKVRGEGDDRG